MAARMAARSCHGRHRADTAPACEPETSVTMRYMTNDGSANTALVPGPPAGERCAGQQLAAAGADEEVRPVERP